MTRAIAVLLLAAGAAASCTSPRPVTQADAPAAVVSLGKVESTLLPSVFEAGGVVRARLTSPVSSRMLAPVLEVRVRPGERVTAGQVLVTLDGRESQALAGRAAAALAAARQSVRAADADRQGAGAALTLATSSFDRISGLRAKRSATNQELDEATAALQAARARVAVADAHAAEAAAALTAADASADAAKIAAAYASIAAPFAGRVTERFVDPGAMAAPGVPLLTVEDPASFRLEARLDEARAQQIAVGQHAGVSVDAAGGAWGDGRIAEIARLDPAGHGFLVKIDLPSSVMVQSGAFGRARFAAAPRATTTAPASAVIRRGQMAFVFAVDRDGFARLRPVTTGPSTGDRVEVLAGVAEGEPIVLNPPLSLTDGTKVRPGAGR